MDGGLVQMIVDLLRKKQEEQAVHAGEPGAQAQMQATQQMPGQAAPAGLGPRGIEPKHGGKTYNEILAEMGA